ncbi:MAG: SET domain-containing protein [Nannocystis sp.]|nr:SET domain-containing protein [Nannocystis sp.]
MSSLPHHKVCTRLRASKIHGIGVFAICPIKAGTMIFPGDQTDMIWVDKSALPNLSPAEKQMYADFCLHRGDRLGCPSSFDSLTPGWYVNHNPTDPNLTYSLQDYSFYAARDIAEGEELTANYHLYSDNVV